MADGLEMVTINALVRQHETMLAMLAAMWWGWPFWHPDHTETRMAVPHEPPQTEESKLRDLVAKAREEAAAYDADIEQLQQQQQVTEAVATDECRASANGGQNERCGTHTAAGGMRDNGGSEEHREEKDDYVGNDVDVKLDDEGWKQVGSSHRAALLAEANRDRMEAQRSADAAAQLQAEAAARQIQRTWRRRAAADTNKQAPVAGEPNDVKLQGGYGGKHGGRKKQRCRRGQKEPTGDDLAELMALRASLAALGSLLLFVCVVVHAGGGTATIGADFQAKEVMIDDKLKATIGADFLTKEVMIDDKPKATIGADSLTKEVIIDDKLVTTKQRSRNKLEVMIIDFCKTYNLDGDACCAEMANIGEEHMLEPAGTLGLMQEVGCSGWKLNGNGDIELSEWSDNYQ